MKRFTLASSSALAALLMCGLASAQGNAGNQNDLRLENEGDFLYVYDDPSIGPNVGSSGVPDFATNTYLWRTFSRDTLRHCSGTMEITSIDFSDFDTDWTAVDLNGNNTAIADLYLSAADPAGPQAPTGTFAPDQAVGLGITFGNGATPGINNAFITDPGCAPAGQIAGYEFQVDLTGGLGAGNGVAITANGATDLLYTTFIPGGGQTITGPSSCVANPIGDASLCDLHSGSLGAGASEQENGFDIQGLGTDSCFGGFGTLGATAGADAVAEVNCNYCQFTEPTLAMVTASGVGHVDPGPAAGVTLTNSNVQLEEGLAGVHYNCPPVGNTQGRLAARLYAWQGLGRPAAVMGTISAPLASCVNFKGGKLGLSPTDPLFNTFLGLWQGAVTKRNNQYALPQNNDFDDAVLDTLALPLPAQLIPIGVTVPLSFQGFYKKTTGTVEGSQVTKLSLHG